MQNDQRLTPLPGVKAMQPNMPVEFSPTGGYPAGYEDTPDSKRSIRQYFQIVYKRLPIIIAITILATVAAAIYSYRLPSMYQTSTNVIIEPRKPPQSQRNVITVNNGDDARYYMTQLELLKSGDLMKRVIISLGFHRDPNLFADQNRGLMAGLRSLFSGDKKPAETTNTLPVLSETTTGEDNKVKVALTPEEDARASSYAGMFTVSVSPVNQTNIVTVAVASTDQARAAKVADGIAQLFIEENEDREIGTSRQAYDELGKSIEGLKATIAQQQNDYIAGVKASALGMGDAKGEVRAGNLEGLLTAWREASIETGKLEAQYRAALNAKGGDALVVDPTNVAIQQLRTENMKKEADLRKRLEEVDTKIDAANEKRMELLATKTEQHRDVITINEKIAELKKQKTRIEGEVSTKVTTDIKKLESDAAKELIASKGSQLAAARQREARQKELFEIAAGQANNEGVAETKLGTLKSELDSNQKLLDTYTSQQKQQELALSTDRPNNIKQQAPAPPAWLTGPARGRNIMVAFLLSFAAGIGLAFLLDFLDDSVRTSDDISRHLGLPTLALIPHNLGTDKRKMLAGKGGASGGEPSTALVTMDEKTSPIAEAYRHLRTSLLFSSAGKPPQTILVTSSQPSEGKTTTAINTAITLAQGDADVVIIDCDLRRPRLHSHFGMDNQRGLTNYLSGDKQTEGLIRTYPDLPKLKIITSGPIPPNPAELLSSNEMRNLLTFLSGKFKHVIIDSPPAISFTDASILSTLVDGVVLVAMANKSSLHLMKQFKQRVTAIGARIYGVVLNGIKANSTEYYYYGSGYYNYYSNPVEDDSTPYMEDVEK
ncbi:MAG: polysaccharide biosynthesis tyrosine autokinase [Pyrinomonadaceae bacterium]